MKVLGRGMIDSLVAPMTRCPLRALPPVPLCHPPTNCATHQTHYHLTQTQTPPRHTKLYHATMPYNSPAHKTAQRSVAWHHCGVAQPAPIHTMPYAICIYCVTSYNSGGFISHPLYHSMIWCISSRTEFSARVIYHSTISLHCIRTARVVLVGWALYHPHHRNRPL